MRINVGIEIKEGVMNFKKCIKENIVWNIEFKIDSIKHHFHCKKYEKKYDDWNDAKWVGDLEMIWGITSWDNMTGDDANMYTMNDIEICYDHESKIYSLGIETAYIFKDTEAEIKYLKSLHGAFTQYMIDNNQNVGGGICLFMSSPAIGSSAKSLEDLYNNFTLFVNGYEKSHGKSEVLDLRKRISDLEDEINYKYKVHEKTVGELIDAFGMSDVKTIKKLYGKNKEYNEIGEYMIDFIKGCDTCNREDCPSDLVCQDCFRFEKFGNWRFAGYNAKNRIKEWNRTHNEGW